MGFLPERMQVIGHRSSYQVADWMMSFRRAEYSFWAQNTCISLSIRVKQWRVDGSLGFCSESRKPNPDNLSQIAPTSDRSSPKKNSVFIPWHEAAILPIAFTREWVLITDGDGVVCQPLCPLSSERIAVAVIPECSQHNRQAWIDRPTCGISGQSIQWTVSGRCIHNSSSFKRSECWSTL